MSRENQESRRGILVVSFGTSYEDTRKKTIDQIEADIQAAYPDYPVYRAWTSRMICRKIQKRDGIYIPDVKEALAKMREDGITEVIVQPTHVINGIENDQMVNDVCSCQDWFDKVAVGTPLLTTQEDSDRMVEEVIREMAPGKDETLVLMGHGTEHHANFVYAALDYQFRDVGRPDIFMGTVEAYPSFPSLLKKVRERNPKRVVLAPFMIVAGDHAHNDLSGDDEESWKNLFEKEGYETVCVLKGLGEYPGVRQLFLSHVEESVRKLV